MTVNGRAYTCAVGSSITVPEFDALELEANGWVGEQGGATATRPANPAKGQQFLDTTLGYIIKFDGKVWRNLATGAAV